MGDCSTKLVLVGLGLVTVVAIISFIRSNFYLNKLFIAVAYMVMAAFSMNGGL